MIFGSWMAEKYKDAIQFIESKNIEGAVLSPR